MGRFGFKPTPEIYVIVSTHGYYYVKRDGQVIRDGSLSELGINYNPYIDDIDDPDIDERAEDGGWADVNRFVMRFLTDWGII